MGGLVSGLASTTLLYNRLSHSEWLHIKICVQISRTNMQTFYCKQVSQHSNQNHRRWSRVDAEGANIWGRRQQSKRETNLIYSLALKLNFPKRPISPGFLFFFTWTHICSTAPIVGLLAYIFFMLPLALHSDGQYWVVQGRRCCVSADHACGSAVKYWCLTLLWYHGVYVTPSPLWLTFFFKLSRILTSPFTYFCVRPS